MTLLEAPCPKTLKGSLLLRDILRVTGRLCCITATYFLNQLRRTVGPQKQSPSQATTGNPRSCFTNVSRALQNNTAKIYNARNHIYGENF